MTTVVFKAACLQLTPGNILKENLKEIARLIEAAVADGAQFVALPEFATYLDRDSRSMRSSATREADSAVLAELRHQAAAHRIWLLIGSLVILWDGDPQARLANRSFLIGPDGTIAGVYNKIHLFDARLADGRVVGESRHYKGGSEAVVVETPFGRIGMSICYDVRFPHLYRALARAGADILVVPSAFTAETGAAHWDALLRSRAIETGCYVFAPATTGVHPGDWHTYGHTRIIDPWGTVIAECGEEGGSFCAAAIDVEASHKARARIPSLATNPEFAVISPVAEMV
ncbi:carbon-nitrogen hydrolase family protein [Sphingomonas sp. AP4-R1]|uniref:carbon-nitrogen hydrolase family protein n=1 Tax=Sphingomonas sp. AP4-R1 TaxID=2735134 RepID=UPI0014932F7D|nr:carbon-nitrogen hydrolase family protein [Sphingomonas sp. AP4-R1]QJU58150.1 carbon-nitrogen hydrolase family protein [Sphingomonas sp. AP4-R1]